MKKIHYLSGLPRSGSTLLSNLLASHPDIRTTPSSPLYEVVQGMRNSWSNSSFLKAQLDGEFEAVHKRLARTTWAAMQAWSDEGGEEHVIEKNRGWLFGLEWLRLIDPNFKIIVTLRDLRSIYGSIEDRHRQTLMLNFPDNMEHDIVDGRAENLFSKNGILGSALKAIRNIADVPSILHHIFFWRYEDFIVNPKETMDMLFQYLEVDPVQIDFNNIVQYSSQSDSHFNMKYPHHVCSSIKKDTTYKDRVLSPRILDTIMNKFSWYYKNYYPEIALRDNSGVSTSGVNQTLSPSLHSNNEEINENDDSDSAMIRELEEAIKTETEKEF